MQKYCWPKFPEKMGNFRELNTYAYIKNTILLIAPFLIRSNY